LSDGLHQMGQADQHQQDERQRRQQSVKGQGAGEKWDVVFVGRLKRTSQKAGG
jgi:hypothetical protein